MSAKANTNVNNPFTHKIMIALIDYGSGNLRSVEKAFLRLGADIHLVSAPEQLSQAKAIVLPGVGAFDDCLTAMRGQ